MGKGKDKVGNNKVSWRKEIGEERADAKIAKILFLNCGCGELIRYGRLFHYLKKNAICVSKYNNTT